MQAEPSWQPQREMRTGSKTEYNKKAVHLYSFFVMQNLCCANPVDVHTGMQ